MNITFGNPLLMGAVKTLEGYNFSMESLEDNIALLLYRRDVEHAEYVIKMDASYKTGNIFSILVKDIDLKEYCYNYFVNEELIVDPYAKSVTDCEQFGSVKQDAVYRSRVELEEFDWTGDRKPEIPYHDCIVYKLHARGFTKSRTSRVKRRGTFNGIIEKIPYLKELGITTIELMPCYEFEEVRRFSHSEEADPYAAIGMEKINYWGYTDALYFAPKASYSYSASQTVSSKDRGSYDYTKEFKELVKELHKNGIEIIMEMFFPEKSAVFIDECIRYWVMEYHIDGVHIYCDETSLNMAASDPLLSKTKIFTVLWNGNGYKNMGNYNDGFSIVARKFLKGDEDQLSAFLNALRNNPVWSGTINYITNHNGFTLYDLVSFDRKHNEENGENNRDGENYNYSWNCGIEGKTKKKKVQELRIRQMKNAFMLLLFSQGTPLILAGDEFENSQNGNNNPYCIDGETTWLTWKNNTNHNEAELFSFVKNLIDFRKSHEILHMSQALTASDYLSCGYPDISYHGSSAWYTGLENYNRHVGIMYCSGYAENGNKEELIYIAYNMHWVEHEMALPKIAEDCKWTLSLYTAQKEETVPVTDNRTVRIPPRSIAVFLGVVKKTADKQEHIRKVHVKHMDKVIKQNQTTKGKPVAD